MSGYSPEERIRELEQMFLGGPIIANGKSFSIETLLDVLLVLYDECCNSTLRREKTVSTFIENGIYYLIANWIYKFENPVIDF
ncbi:hypothetical protein TNIN_380581 [Trichonephila inaurata madagascariensis]|uniref:Uncharacterized protein n=1 Tax=Trichonephila inaurata madagascariensis TaxID=2747483 RepID=A0A8X6IPK7_9ARAC|nr:hypothetical protein TNIN_380581 [Trichonephila inaurata madagascariensis]